MKVDGNNPVDNKDLYGKVKGLDGAQETEKKKGAEKAHEERDKISLSGKAKEISELKAEIAQLPDIRTDKVDSIKQAIDTGNYNIDARKIAQKILEEI